MKFDPSGLNRAFERMEKTAHSKGKDLAVQQGNFFNSMARKIGWEIAPTRDELEAVFRKLNGRMKRAKGKTPLQELERRKRARGTFARGWHVLKLESLRGRIRIWIGNDVKYSGIVEDQHDTTKKAGQIVQGRFRGKLDRYAKQVTGVF